MGQPAARAGDSTAHGGVIAAGAPTVFIGKMPAARLGDPHVCPQVNPGKSAIPHAGMPIAKGSIGVNICGMPAARTGDLAPCNGPPDVVVTGCPTVNIGENKGTVKPAPTLAQICAATSAAAAGAVAEAEMPEDHFIDVAFKDSANLPVSGGFYTLTHPDESAENGTQSTCLKRYGIPEGEYKLNVQAITGVRWSVQEARDGETVQCLVDTYGIEDGTSVILTIWMKNLNMPDKAIFTTKDLTISSDKCSFDWKPSFYSETNEDEGSGFMAPFFFFTVTILGQTERSGLLTYRDFIEIQLLDENDEPIANQEYRAKLSSAEVRSGKTDNNGYFKVENIPPGNCEIEYPGMEDDFTIE